jgi:23S rRNA A1618 N6-methylase RlmF
MINLSSSYEQVLEKSGRISLKVRWLRTIAQETCKILNDVSPEYLNDLLHLKHSNQEQTHMNTGKKSFRYIADKLLNQLQENSRQTSSFNLLKSLIKT